MICKAGDLACVAELDGKHAGARGGASFLGAEVLRRAVRGGLRRGPYEFIWLLMGRSGPLARQKQPAATRSTLAIEQFERWATTSMNMVALSPINAIGHPSR